MGALATRFPLLSNLFVGIRPARAVPRLRHLDETF
jgi:hypothetical protein